MLDRNAEEIIKRFKEAITKIGNLTPEDCIEILAIILEDYEVKMW